MRLRIISGKFKGRFISVPKSNLIRPTSDRNRETLFNILNNKINFNGIKVLDIYAGSGALGFEALSRGAEKVHFVENNFAAYKNLDENIKSLKTENECKIFKLDAIKFVEIHAKKNYDLIFADPPYLKSNVYALIKKLKENNFLSENGMIIIERSIKTKEVDIKNFKIEPFKIIGDTCLYEL